MTIEPPREDDWDLFLAWAREEGWRVPAREVALLRRPLAAGVFVLREDGRMRGFATIVMHEQSGWIGNLIVDPTYRGQGRGSLLFEHALRRLQQGGARSVWLTASTKGRPIYARRGFETAGKIVRWVRPPMEFSGPDGIFSAPSGPLSAADARAWGESRRPFLDLLLEEGRVFVSGGTSALLQGGEDMQILGPWYSPGLCPRENRQLLQNVLAAADPATELVADVAGESPMQALLAAAGFEPRGGCDLMVHGRPCARRVALVALASLGSMG